MEDLFLSFTFARNGHAPKFCPNVSVTSCFPTSDDAGAKQRARWEHGSLATAHRTALPAFIDGVVSANWRLCALALDAIIPPIIILIAVTMMLVGMAAALALLGANASVGPALMAFFSVVFGVAVSWAAYGRKALPPSKLKGAGAFLLEKLNVYGASGRRASQTWTRTDRDPSDDAS